MTQRDGSAAAEPANRAAHRDGNGRHVEFPVDSQFVVDAGGTRVTNEGHPAFADPEAEQKTKETRKRRVRTVVFVLIAAAILGVGLYFGLPALREALDTVSTDDAFVSGHVTNVSPRVSDLVTEVLVDQDDRVEPGMLLVRLDRQPFAIQVAQSEARLEQSKANLVNARARVRSQIATARAAYYQRKNAQERLRQQVSTLRARVATLRSRESSLRLAEVDQKRLDNLVKRGTASQSELDTRNNTLDVARENLKEAWAQVQETRALLGLPADDANPLDLPKDLEENQSTVQSAVSDIATSLAEIGIEFDPKDAVQAKAFNDFLKPTGDKSAGEGIEAVVEQAPGVRVARAGVDVAREQLDDDKLQLSYTEIRAEIAGHVQDRTVHPGNRVEPGQTLLSVRPDYVWIDANYKETQLRYIRIGMPVDLHVDAYPKRVFKARVAGFSPGTGLAGSLLPPENATGNYIKVTQRLPVRLELAEPNPTDTPLFVGLSVVPKVRFKLRATGPGAGERLHARDNHAGPDLGAGPAGVLPDNRPEDRPAGGRP